MSVLGFKSRVGGAKESAWGTGVAANTFIPVLNFDFNRKIEPFVSEMLTGLNAQNFQDSGCGIVAGGSIEAEMCADADDLGVGQLLLGGLGSDSWDATNLVDKIVSTEDSLPSFTFAGLVGSNIKEIQGAKVKSLKISGKANESIIVSVDLIGKDVLVTGDTGIVNSSIPSYSRPNNIFRFCDLEFWLGSGALSSANEKQISEFELTLDNKLSDPEFVSNSQYTLEPEFNGFRELTLSITLPREDAIKTYRDYLANGSIVSSQLNLADSGGYYKKIFLPRLILSTNPEQIVNGAGIIPVKLEFKGMYNNGDNSLMKFTDGTIVNGLIGIETKDERSSTIA